MSGTVTTVLHVRHTLVSESCSSFCFVSLAWKCCLPQLLQAEIFQSVLRALLAWLSLSLSFFLVCVCVCFSPSLPSTLPFLIFSFSKLFSLPVWRVKKTQQDKHNGRGVVFEYDDVQLLVHHRVRSCHFHRVSTQMGSEGSSSRRALQVTHYPSSKLCYKWCLLLIGWFFFFFPSLLRVCLWCLPCSANSVINCFVSFSFLFLFCLL